MVRPPLEIETPIGYIRLRFLPAAMNLNVINHSIIPHEPLPVSDNRHDPALGALHGIRFR